MCIYVYTYINMYITYIYICITCIFALLLLSPVTYRLPLSPTHLACPRWRRPPGSSDASPTRGAQVAGDLRTGDGQ